MNSLKTIKLASCVSLLFASFIFASDFSTTQKRYSQATLIEASFTQEKQIKFISKKIITKGKFKLAQSVGLIWQMTDPFKSTSLVTDNGIFIKKNNQFIKENDRQLAVVNQVMTGILLAQKRDIASMFNITHQPSEQYLWQIRLTPNDSIIKKAIQSINIYGNKDIQQIDINDNNKNRTTIYITDIQVQKKPLTTSQKKLFLP